MGLLESFSMFFYNSFMLRKRISDFLRNSRTTVVIVLAVVVVLAVVFIAITWNTNNYNETVRGTASDFWGKSPSLRFGDQSIPFDTQVSNILIIGTDKRETAADLPKSHRNNGQADFLLLVSINHRNKVIRQLHIDRDTLADIVVLSVLGEERGTRRAQICLAHSFGQTEAISATLTARAVSGLLFDAPIEHICSLDMNNFPDIIDFIGGITITPTEDHPTIDSRLIAGKSVKMDGELAFQFVRSRMNVDDGSNISRMNRQREFMDGFSEALGKFTHKDVKRADAFYRFLVQKMFTTMTKGSILNLVNRVLHYRVEPITRLEGQYLTNDNGYIEMHPDLAALERLAMDWFTADQRQ